MWMNQHKIYEGRHHTLPAIKTPQLLERVFIFYLMLGDSYIYYLKFGQSNQTKKRNVDVSISTAEFAWEEMG